MSSQTVSDRTLSVGRLLVTGGTRGIGLAIGLEAARLGTKVCLTHRWGSVADEDIVAEFARQGLCAPRIEECDASDPLASAALIDKLYEEWGGLEAIVSGVAFAAPVNKLSDLKRESLELALGYTAWPLLDMVQASLKHERPPRRFLVLSSGGIDRVFPSYDMVAVSKAALETLVRYLAIRLKPHGITVNALRAGCVDTESLRAIFKPAAGELGGHVMNASAAARAAVALLSGMMDAVTGQIVTADEGASLLPAFHTAYDQ